MTSHPSFIQSGEELRPFFQGYAFVTNNQGYNIQFLGSGPPGHLESDKKLKPLMFTLAVSLIQGHQRNNFFLQFRLKILDCLHVLNFLIWTFCIELQEYEYAPTKHQSYFQIIHNFKKIIVKAFLYMKRFLKNL